jgi:hypothetical protein
MSTQNEFAKKGYCIVRSAISDELRDFVTQTLLFDESQRFVPGINGEDAQVPGSYASYANPITETVLLHLQKTMEEATGLKLHPTYSYYRIYRNGAELVKHTDRQSCEISCTLCFNYSYDDKSFSWPIYISNDFPADLKPGDMLIYRGMDLPHWRYPLNHSEDVWHAQGFFHYVNQDGPCADFKFDKREQLGLLPEEKRTQIKSFSNKSYLEFK